MHKYQERCIVEWLAISNFLPSLRCLEEDATGFSLNGILCFS